MTTTKSDEKASGKAPLGGPSGVSKQDEIDAVLLGLTSLDAEIRLYQGGASGSGIYTLLDMLAGQFLGVPRGIYPTGTTTPPAAPVNVDVPYLSPINPAPGMPLICTMGNWHGEPTEYVYEWFRDDAVALADGPENTYVVQAGEIGASIYCVVTAANATGATAAPPSNSVVVQP